MVDPPATLTITSDFPSGTYTGVFEFGPYGSESRPGSIEEAVDDKPLLDNSFDQTLSLVPNTLTDPVLSGDGRQSVNIDVGAGTHGFQLQASLNHSKVEGSHPQWGSSADPAVGPNEHTATGANPITQGIVFLQYLTVDTTDSLKTATFEMGPYSTGGFLDPLDVAVRNPSWEIRSSGRDVQVSCDVVVTSKLNNPVDLSFLNPWG